MWSLEARINLGETFVYVLPKISGFFKARRDKGKMRKEGEKLARDGRKTNKEQASIRA